LRRPVRRDFLAGHAPHFFSVALEEGVEEAFAELIAHPILEVRRIADGQHTRLHPGEDAEGRLEDTELHEGLNRFQWIGEKLSAVENAR
jgi:hypothetical protein